MARDLYVTYEESTPPPTWVMWLVSVGFLVPTVSLALEAVRLLQSGELRAALGTGALAGALLLGPLLLHLLFGRLHVRVTHTSLVLSFGYLPWIRKLVLFDEIAGLEPVTYRPLLEFGGWGIRWGFKGKKAWTARGNRALRLTLTDGTLLYVGSDDPVRLGKRIRVVGGGRWQEPEPSPGARPAE